MSNRIWPGLIAITLLLAAIITTLIKTRYIISDDNKLNVKCWFVVNLDIDIKSIHRIRKTYNLLASPAASIFGRIEVFYDNGKVNHYLTKTQKDLYRRSGIEK